MSSPNEVKHTGNVDVWQVANDLTEGDYVSVMYDSTRSDMVQFAKGEAIEVDAGGDGVTIRFRRDDGQVMKAKSNGKLLSEGSNFPLTGKIASITIV